MRLLNDAIHEALVSMDDAAKAFSYQITDGPGPISKAAVKNYIGRVALSPEGEGTRVVWTSTYESADEKAVGEFCNPIYQALLSAMGALPTPPEASAFMETVARGERPFYQPGVSYDAATGMRTSRGATRLAST